MCDPRRCARRGEGGAGGEGRGGERREGLPSPQPAPPSRPSAGRGRPLAGAEGSWPGASRRQGPARSPGPRYPPPEQPQRPCLPPAGFWLLQGRARTCAVTAAAHGRRFLSVEARTPHLRAGVWQAPPSTPPSPRPQPGWKPTANASSCRAFRLCAPWSSVFPSVKGANSDRARDDPCQARAAGPGFGKAFSPCTAPPPP